MRAYQVIVVALLGGTLAASTIAAQGSGTRRVRITYQNLTSGQAFSPSVFMAHSAAAPKLFAMGGKASFESAAARMPPRLGNSTRPSLSRG